MLTESELKWLKDRKIPRAACRWEDDIMHPCLMSRYGGKWFEAECDQNEYCVYLPDYKDAAEFEARVAIRIARYARMVGVYGADDWRLWDLLKFARMAVEEEMDAHN